MSDAPTVHQQAQARSTLRALHRQLDENKQSYTSTTSTGLAEVQKQANDMFATASTESRGTALDASLLNRVSALGAEQAGNLDKAAEGFIRRLKNKFGIGGNSARLNWQKLGDELEAAQIYMHVPGITFLLGEVAAPVQKQRKERKTKERATQEPLQTAASVAVGDLQEVADNKAQTARMKILQNKVLEVAGASASGQVNMFQLLLHPTSFSQTVENFFDLAFLVKDGHVQLEATPETIFVRPRNPPTTADFDGGVAKQQNVLKLDRPIYQKLVDRWCTAESPMLPDRGLRPPGVDDERTQPAAPAAKKRKQ